MATVYATGIKRPEFPQPYDFNEDLRREKEYVDKVRAMCKGHARADELSGKIISFPYADGHAEYMVFQSKPLKLVHLEVGDAWGLPDWQLRGLKLADVKRMAY